jgi:hypothetical protein
MTSPEMVGLLTIIHVHLLQNAQIWCQKLIRELAKLYKHHVVLVLTVIYVIHLDVPVFHYVHTVALQWIEEVFTVLDAQTAQIIHSSILEISGIISWMVFNLSEDIIMNSQIFSI